MRIIIPRRVIEENAECAKEYDDYYPYADDLEYEFTTEEVDIDYGDLEEIVDEYLDDVLDILIHDYRDKLLKALKNYKKEMALK
ncbi:hypothetical protein J5U23_00687 [Saccharolobus shibatae B12]|uniref:Uncharacterized protein n=1 Tax=Saccharolobus shibatae (strain ATCC 51178 / DSM 5389 / JCM 8931 / NBRC 15437 / B12) TaxID=523848 RepID=A0A8F5BMA8_SACSH|nr:hypothetical protein [Saccharolobus shibatae]QXJ27819.1 hypothetical protein J5U23_00687 [Saccharolobus shibatae B12]